MLSSSSSSTYLEKCSECSGQIIDAGDEFVCQSCGMVTAKEVLEGRERKMPQALDYTPHALGGFLGPPEQEYEEQQSPPTPPAFRSEERRVGKECTTREAPAQSTN